MRFLLILILSIPLYSQSSKVLCELNGEYSVTYKDIKKTYLAEGIELFRNLARQTQQSLFLLRRQKLILLKKIGKKILYMWFNIGMLILLKKPTNL